MNRIGIDKTMLHIPPNRFSVRPDADIKIQVMVSNKTKQAELDPLFRFTNEDPVYGTKAFLNVEDLCNVSINQRGLSVSYNPSKPYHPYELVSDKQEFVNRSVKVFDELEQRGISADWNEASVCRLDVARNVSLPTALINYRDWFSLLSTPRQSQQVYHEHSFRIGNNQKMFQWYDKTEEADLTQEGITRGEIQWRSSEKIRADFKIMALDDIDLDAISDKYRKDMRSVLQVKEAIAGTQLVFDYGMANRVAELVKPNRNRLEDMMAYLLVDDAVRNGTINHLMSSVCSNPIWDVDDRTARKFKTKHLNIINQLEQIRPNSEKNAHTRLAESYFEFANLLVA